MEPATTAADFAGVARNAGVCVTRAAKAGGTWTTIRKRALTKAAIEMPLEPADEDIFRKLFEGIRNRLAGFQRCYEVGVG